MILPADERHDYFALLGAPRRFDLAAASLELAFKETQKALHPDKFSTRPEARARRAVREGRLRRRALTHRGATAEARRRSGATPRRRLRA